MSAFLIIPLTALAFQFSPLTPPASRTIEITLEEGTNMAAALSPDGQTIVIDLLGRLWLLPATGGDAQAITDPLGDARQPAWSPDGNQICFQAYWSGNWHIYSVQKDGGQLQQLTHGPFDHREPHWSPDGRQIVFSSDREGSYDLWVLELESGAINQITNEETNEYGPVWSPDGSEIAYISDNPSQKGLHVWSLSEATRQPAYASSEKLAGASWSPDGRYLLFNELSFAESKLLQISAKKSKDEAVLLSKAEDDVFPFRASWLSNAEYIYTSTGQIRRGALGKAEEKTIPFQVRVKVNRHTYPKKRHDFDPGPPQTTKGIAWPTISPDGRRIAFVALGDLWLQKTKGGAARQLTDNAYVEIAPAWSPDGRLAYISDQGGAFAIWTMDAANGKHQKLSEVEGSPAGIDWSPDGQKIAYAAGYGPRLGQLWTINAQNGQAQKTGPFLKSSIGAPSWSADGQSIAVSVLQPYSSLYREGINRVLYISSDGEKQWGLRSLEQWSLGVRAKDGPVWSPDGKYLALISQGLLWIAPVDREGQINGPPIRLTNELADMPTWTADAQNILFMATDRLKKINIKTDSIKEIPVNLNWVRKAPEERTIIHAGGLFDGLNKSLQKDVDLIIERNRILAIEKHDPNRRADKKIDASEAFVMPGLIDIHAHQGSWGGEKLNRSWLAWGVTATRDPATDPYDALNRKEAQAAGQIVGPRVFFTGSPIDGNRVYYAGTYAQQSPAQVELELKRAEALGYDMIKTYVRLPDPLQKRVVAKAHELGVPVSSHELYPAVAYGTDGVEHIQGTSRRGYSPKITDILRSYGDVSELLGASGMTFTPTTGIYVSYAYLLAQNEVVLDDPRLKALETPFALQGARRQIEAVKANPKDWEKRFINALKMVKDVHDKGGIVVAGTDSPIIPYGFALHMELESYAEAGLSAFEVLQTTTINAARALGAGDDLGSVEAGKLADLLILEANPLEDVRNIRKIQKVVQNGNIYTLEEILKQP